MSSYQQYFSDLTPDGDDISEMLVEEISFALSIVARHAF